MVLHSYASQMSYDRSPVGNALTRERETMRSLAWPYPGAIPHLGVQLHVIYGADNLDMVTRDAAGPQQPTTLVGLSPGSFAMQC